MQPGLNTQGELKLNSSRAVVDSTGPPNVWPSCALVLQASLWIWRTQELVFFRNLASRARSCIRDGARGRFYNVVDLVNRLETEVESECDAVAVG